MTKVIIITRDNAYSGSNAYNEYSQRNNNCGNQHIHKYIATWIKTCYYTYTKDPDKAAQHWDPLTRKIDKLLPYNKLYSDEILEPFYNDDSTEEAISWLWNHLHFEDIIRDALLPIEQETTNNVDNKPYINFQYNGFDVHFVFLNRIFDTFVDISNYNDILNDDNRLDFIKAICQDCGLLDDYGKLIGNEKAILYIHDKEWYEREVRCVLYDGEWKIDSFDKFRNLEDLFSIIQVFQHTDGPFAKIKQLDFTFPEEEHERRLRECNY